MVYSFKREALINHIGVNLLFGTLSTYICAKWGVEAQSAGLPELKCILSGGKMLQFL